MTSTHEASPQALPSHREAQPRAVENRRVVIAAALFAALLIGEAALFMLAVRTVPGFVDYTLAYPVP